VHKTDGECIWHFVDEGAARSSREHPFWFCARRIHMHRRIEAEGMKSRLAMSTMFADMFAGIVEGPRITAATLDPALDSCSCTRRTPPAGFTQRAICTDLALHSDPALKNNQR
jgi:hypothetical protein